MFTTTVIRFKEFDLRCSARAIEGGRFEPVLVVAKAAWPSRPRTIAVVRGDHVTQEAAAAAAHLQGIAWVETYG